MRPRFLTRSAVATNGNKKAWPNEITKMSFVTLILCGLLFFANKAHEILEIGPEVASNLFKFLIMLPASALVIDVGYQLLRVIFLKATAGKRARAAREAERDQREAERDRQLEEALQELKVLREERQSGELRPIRPVSESSLLDLGGHEEIQDLDLFAEEPTDRKKQ